MCSSDLGQVNVAVLSRGGIPHLTSEWIKVAAGLEWTSINYPGTPAGLSDLMGGRVQVIMDGLPSLAGSISATRAPYSTARCAVARPPLTPPTTSKSNVCKIFLRSVARKSTWTSEKCGIFPVGSARAHG